MDVAIIIPCLNEEATIAKVVQDCHKHLPTAKVYVLDNGSSDRTAEIARQAGALVTFSPLQGKGHVLRHAFRVITADYYVMIDGDGTYPVSEAPRLIKIAREYNYEMVMGSRLELGKAKAFRLFHYSGNLLFSALVRILFRYPIVDLLTGYRVFSRRFVEQVSLVSRGFEVETELTIRALAHEMAFAEVSIPYAERPPGSHSKLRTFRDGWIILCTVLRLWKSFRPLSFCLSVAALALVGSLFVAPAYINSLSTCAALFAAIGFYLDTRLDAGRFRMRIRNPLRRPSMPRERRKSA